jgi:nitroreductase
MADVLELIYKRRSIRAFEPRPVARELLVELIRAGMAAPSAVNRQPWEFIVVTTPERMSLLQGLLPYGKYPAPSAILVCGRPDLAQNDTDGNFWVQDCSAATENLLIAAAGLCLGAGWTAVYPKQALIKQVNHALGIPSFVIPLNVILVGWPAEEKPPRSQYREDRVHWEQY